MPHLKCSELNDKTKLKRLTSDVSLLFKGITIQTSQKHYDK